jgi:hypothetical protein
MYYLNRILISRFGHATAYFPGTVVGLSAPGSDEPVSTLLSAVNGAGKTTLVSAVLSVFDPHRDRFVQTLQKPAHRFHHYVREKAGIVALELAGPARPRRMDLLGTAVGPDRDILVVGYVCSRSSASDTDPNRRFFLFQPGEGLTFDDLPWPGTAAPESGRVETWEEALKWMQSCERLTARQESGFQKADSQDAWHRMLKARHVPVDMLIAQVDMARTEGGIDRMFSEMRSNEKVLRHLMSTTGAGDMAEQRMGEIRRYAEGIRRTAQLGDEHAAAVEMEASIARVESTRADHSLAQAGLGKVHLARDALAAGLRARLARLAGEERDLDGETRDVLSSRADRQADLTAASARVEAVRIEAASVSRRELEARRGDANAAIRSAAVLLGAVEHARSGLGVRALSEDLADARARLDVASARMEDLLAPLRTAGGRLRMRLDVESRRLDDAAAEAKRASGEQRKAAGEAHARATTSTVEAARAGDKLREAEVAGLALKESFARGLRAGAFVEGEDPEAAPDRLREDKEAAEDGLALAASEKSRASEASARRLRTFEDARRLETECKSALDRAERELAQRDGALLELSAREAVQAVLGQGSYDPAGAEAISTLSLARTDHMRRQDEAQVELTALTVEQEAIAAGFAFLDPAAERVVAKLGEIGVAGRHAPLYVSETVSDADMARRIVESDPGRYLHGVLVATPREVEKARAAFERTDWALARAVTISAMTDAHDVRPPVGGSFVAAAGSDIAYSKEARDRRAAEIRARLPRLREQITAAEAAARSLAEAIATAEGLAADERRTPREGLAEKVRAARSALVEAQEAVEAAKEAARLADVDNAAAGTRHAEAFKLDKEAGDRFSRLLPMVSRHLADRDRIPSAAEIETLHRVAEEARARTAGASAEAAAHEASAASLLEQSHALSNSAAASRRDMESIAHHGPADGVDPIADGTELAAVQAAYKAMSERLAGNDRELDELAAGLEECRKRAARAEDSMASKLAALGDLAIDAARAAEGLSGLPESVLDLQARDARLALGVAQDRLPPLDREIGGIENEMRPSGEHAPALLESKREDARSALASGSLPGELQRLAAEEKAAAIAALDVLRRTLATLGTRKTEIERGEKTVLAAMADLKAPREGALGPEPDGGSREWGEAIAAWNRSVSNLEEAAGVARRAYVEAAEGWRSKARLPVMDAAHTLKALLAKHDPAVHPTEQETLSGALRDVTAIRESLAHRIAGQQADMDNVSLTVRVLLDDVARRLDSALKAKLPPGAASFAGKPVLRTDVDVKAGFSGRDVLAPRFVREALPGMIDGSGKLDITGEEFAARLVEFALVKAPAFEILKPVSQSSRVSYEPLTKMTGSGGQVLTAALLFHIVVCNVRADNGNTRTFLVLDNPLGAANASELVETQLSFAAALNVQLIVASGVRDQDAVGQFGNVVTWRSRRDRTGNSAVELDTEIWATRHGVETPVFRQMAAAE